MPDTLSKNWLLICAVVSTLLVGTHPGVLSYVILIMGFLWLFMLRDTEGHFARPNTITAILFLVALTYAAVALQWSPIPARALYDLIIVALMGWVGVQSTAAMKIIDSANTNQLMRVTVIAFLAAMIFFAADLFFDVIVQRVIQKASWSKFVPLSVVTRQCFCMVLLLWPVVAYIWQRGWRAAAILLWLMVGIFTLFTDTAAGRLAFIVSSLVFVFANFSSRLMRVIFGAIILTGFAVATPIAQIAQGSFGDQAKHMSGSFGQRTEIWTFTAKRIMEKPIFGWGFDSARAIPNFGEVSVYLGNDPTKSIIPMHPHDWFLQILLELGLVGAVFVGAFWVWLIWRTEKFNRRIQPAVLAVVGVVFSIGAFSIGIWQIWWWAAVLFAIWVLQWLDRTQSEP